MLENEFLSKKSIATLIKFHIFQKNFVPAKILPLRMTFSRKLFLLNWFIYLAIKKFFNFLSSFFFLLLSYNLNVCNNPILMFTSIFRTWSFFRAWELLHSIKFINQTYKFTNLQSCKYRKLSMAPEIKNIVWFMFPFLIPIGIWLLWSLCIRKIPLGPF